jgi:transcriptional regulator with XRE-family HTH domain
MTTLAESREPAAARVARRLRAARVKARMTVREVAACLDVDHTLIVKYENGGVQPSINRLDALARLYGMAAPALLAEHDESMPLLTAIDQASAAQLAQLAQMLAEISASA